MITLFQYFIQTFSLYNKHISTFLSAIPGGCDERRLYLQAKSSSLIALSLWPCVHLLKATLGQKIIYVAVMEKFSEVYGLCMVGTKRKVAVRGSTVV